jgi:hypothetical protein
MCFNHWLAILVVMVDKFSEKNKDDPLELVIGLSTIFNLKVEGT